MTEPGAGPPSGIRVEGVTKSFANRTVLDGIDLEVANGHITAVLGPSGCGKTTLLRIIAGFEEPDGGAVSVGGVPVVGAGTGRRDGSVPAHRRRVGLMPQEGALFPQLSVGRNVTFGLPRARRSDTAIAEHWLGVVGLDGLADARPHQLSAEPSVLLLDEPFAALDAGLRVRVREEIATILRATQTTALLVTHDQAEALSLADSVALLIAGRVAQHGPPAQLYDRPVNLEVARFVGGTVELDGDIRGGILTCALGSHRPEVAPADGPVTVVVRPERVHVVDPACGAQAVVTECRFYGAELGVHVVLGDGTALVLRLPATRSCSAGQRVGLAVDGPVLAYPR
ncbi:ferric cations import ATP-binding protein FbpC [Mycolicibacterium neoaurum]|uniref:Ferric cations import ATP-binding protein FbpC n=1 Tax=Mycolicibacterium neoaurum TaxID=1795 RepID=A0AAV2WP64_MYCNE|nr:ferric cations import ATP-binding protein FbpC [Mycolicibacterium neoaurum]